MTKNQKEMRVLQMYSYFVCLLHTTVVTLHQLPCFNPRWLLIL